MAEVVGIVAAAVQFIELGTKLLIAASKLRSKLDNAPEKVKTSERSVRRLVSLVRTLETDLQPTSSTTLTDILTNENKLEAEDILDDCSKEASALLDLLNGFTIKADDNFVKGKMRAFSYVKKEDEVAERCKWLDELSSRLVLWYHHQTLSLQKRQLDALFSTNNAINAIGTQMHAGFTAVAHSLQQQQGAMALSPSLPITPIDSSVTFHRWLSRSAPINAYLLDCTCRWSHLMKWAYNVGALSFMSKQSGVHERSCPYYGKNQTRDSRITIGFSIPWLFSQRVQLSFASLYTKGAYSICPTLRTVNIVDKSTSPAFAHLESADDLMHDLLREKAVNICSLTIDTTLIGPLKGLLETLYSELEEDFKIGVSSAKDVLSDGTSMLHYLFLILGVVSIYQDHLAELAASLLQLLIDFGIDINAERQIFRSGTTKGQNTLLLLKRSMDLAYMAQQENTSVEFINLLYRAGIDAPVWDKNPYTISFLEPSLFPKVPDLALEVGYPKLTFAVISRDEHNLRTLIRAGHNVNEIYIQPFTAICYSIGWPEGCQILLESGADPNDALSTAFKYLDVAVVRRLLDAGCAVFAKRPPLEQFLGITRAYISSKDKRSEILSLIIKAMADSRRRFMCLARDNAPRQALIQYGWTDPSVNDTLLDGGAVMVAKLLDKLKIQIPRNLHPGVRRSVYHQIELTAEAAQLLYSSGFTEIDLQDQNGCSPFMLCLIRMRIRSHQYFRAIPMSWFLDRGVCSLHHSSTLDFNLLHLLSTCFGKGVLSHTLPLRNFTQELGDLDAVVHHVSKLCNPHSRDLCECWCSSGGCLPLTLLFKRLWPVFGAYASIYRRKYTSWSLIDETLKGWMRWYGCDLADHTLLEEVCRLEVFQRLGMAHTCCYLDVVDDQDLGYMTFSTHSVSESEREHLQDEDGCSKIQLEALLNTYSILCEQYSGSAARLWIVWWEILEDYLPQRVWIRQDREYIELENPWCNPNLPDPQDLCTKTDEIKNRVVAAMSESTSSDPTK